MLVRHMLQSLAALHRCGLSHGHPMPDSFQFHSEQPHASLKLVDFGLDLKVHMWDSAGAMLGGTRGRCRRTACLQFFETCRIVFCAPEVVLPLKACKGSSGNVAGRKATNWVKGGPAPAAVDGMPQPMLEGEHVRAMGDPLTEAIDAHLEQADELHTHGLMEAADAWSMGAITFLLLCGYPPFFAPCRCAILTRIDKVDYAFDPPFWSKISEEAKDFVQQCLHGTPGRRLSVINALKHPWIQSLADTSASGSMLSSFSLNLRRFYRTSLIEAFAANSLAAKLSHNDACTFHTQCFEADIGRSGFITASDLRQILMGLGHNEIADAIGMCFSRTLRHPGESYIDYTTLVESIRVRRERLLEENLWRQFSKFAIITAGGDPDVITDGHRLPLADLSRFVQEPEVQSLLKQAGVEDCMTLAKGMQLLVSVHPPCIEMNCDNSNSWDSDTPAAGPELDFIEVASEIIQQLPTMATGTPTR